MGGEIWVSESRVLGAEWRWWKGLQVWSLRVQESMDWRESRGLRDMGKWVGLVKRAFEMGKN